ncbi:hypothetical protein [uncultured Clostridium sp.]|uniref:anthrax toxin lethal factor-related metalloendopeptidase n=1 Tax=uncultured Clostridium sp. TaxID=59620 RepID=UPI0025CF2809|nr:hypothetical protein [uncultured Clostridium sp.]
MKRYLSLLLILISLFSFGCQKSPEKVEETPKKVEIVKEVKEEPKSAKNELTPEERLASVSLDMFPLFQNTGYSIEIVTDSISNYGYEGKDDVRGVCDFDNKRIIVQYTIMDDYGSFFEKTIYHEMAHAIEHEKGKLSLSSGFSNCYDEALNLLSAKELRYTDDYYTYYLNDPIEYFAESFAIYKQTPDIVKEYAPLTYDFFESNMK